MIGLAFYNEVDRAIANIVSAWDFTASTWGFDGILIIDTVRELLGRRDQRAYETLTDLVAAFPTHKFVYLLPRASVPSTGDMRTSTLLPDYNHPTSNAIYVVGSNVTGIDKSELYTQNGSEIVSIETAGTMTDRSMWSFDAGLIVAYDRFIKTRLLP